MVVEKKKTGKAIIVGGSIAGLASAHALTKQGWEVVVIEKAASPPKGSPTGAGLGLDPLSIRLLETWVGNPELIQQATLPLSFAQEQAIDRETKAIKTLARDDNFNFRAVHWSDLHGLLYSALPPQIFLWGYTFLSLSVPPTQTQVTIKAKALQTGNIVEISGDLLVAADGCLSSVRQTFLPDLKLRYTGYCGWRGVIDFSTEEDSETIKGLRKVYPELGRGLTLSLTTGSHTAIYELPRKRVNWIWFLPQPEPETKGTSLTMKASAEMIENMYQEAEKVWPPEFVRVIRETKEPFINLIYDCDPLDRIFWDNVVCVGDAAHPTTPHGARGANMSLLDAMVLGKCLQKWGAAELSSALEEYQSIRLPVASKQVLHSRRMGRIKQGLSLPDGKPFDPVTATPEDAPELQHKFMPFFYDVPAIIN